MQSWIKWLLLAFMGAAALAYAGACALFRAGEAQFLFTRDTTVLFPSVSLALNQERVEFGKGGDEKFIAWLIPSLPQDRSDNWIIFFHGSGTNISLATNVYETLRSMGFNVMAPEYPGYLDAPGEPGEAIIEREAQAAYDYLREVKNAPPRRIVIFGSNFGAAVAIDLARRVEAAGLIEYGGFSSHVAIDEKRYPLLPVRMLTRNRFESDKKIAGVKMPVLLIHSGDDPSVPFAHAEALYALAPSRKKLVKLNGRRNTIQASGRASPTFFAEMTAFLNAQAGMNLRQPLPSIAIAFADTLDAKGIEAALAHYRSLRKENPPRYNFRESELNELGYEYIADEKYDEAIATFQLNVEQYPQSFNVYDSLGDAYEGAGKDAEAIEAFRKSVAVFPDKDNYSRPKLERLERTSRGD